MLISHNIKEPTWRTKKLRNSLKFWNYSYQFWQFDDIWKFEKAFYFQMHDSTLLKACKCTIKIDADVRDNVNRNLSWQNSHFDKWPNYVHHRRMNPQSKLIMYIARFNCEDKIESIIALHTTYSWNIKWQKCASISCLWVLNEIFPCLKMPHFRGKIPK